MAKWVAALLVAINIVSLTGWLIWEVLTGWSPPAWLPLGFLAVFCSICAAFIMLNPYSGIYSWIRWPGKSNIWAQPGDE